MGVDTKAIIRKGTTLQELKNHLENKYGEVTIRSTSSEGYYQLIFKEPETIEGAASHRSLNVFYGSHVFEDYKIDGVLLSLGYWGSNIEIMKYILSEFGGYLDENDCDDKDFYPVEIEKFYQSKELTPKDIFHNKLFALVGADKFQDALNLFEEYKLL